MNNIPADTISESFCCKGVLEGGALVFATHLKAVLPFQSMEIALFLNGDRDDKRSLYSFHIAPEGIGSLIKFQFSDHGITPDGKYELRGTIYFWIKKA